MANNVAGSGALNTLKMKMQSLRDELDKCRDEYDNKCHELETERNAKNQIEHELAAVCRKLSLVEVDYDQAQTRLETSNLKLLEYTKMIDENERSRRVLENRQNIDDDRMENLERDLKASKVLAVEAERKYEEAMRKLQMTDLELERSEERADNAERKIKLLDTELLNVTNALKSLEHNDAKSNQREETYEESIRDLSARLKDSENRSSEFERSLTKLQREVEVLEDELLKAKNQNKTLKDELENAFNEIANI